MALPWALRSCLQRPCVLRSRRAPLGGAAGAGLILQSLSDDVYQNLAVEDWIHEQAGLEDRQVLFLWRNAPAVVVGRHQNPWQECDLRLLRQKGVKLARRRSGGGAVYHDLGNINLTFFTSRTRYERRDNLELVVRALRALSPRLDVRVTERYDIVLGGRYKISGTAAKLGRTAAYHHCTLLCGADKSLLSALLRSPYRGLRSNATASVPSAVRNLVEEDPALTCERLLEAVAEEYAARHHVDRRVTLINPADEAVLPGIHRKTKELQTWEWVYGKTPKFSVSTYFDLTYEDSVLQVKVDMEVKHGKIEVCNIDAPEQWLPPGLCQELAKSLTGSRFCPDEATVLASTWLRTCPRDDELRHKCNLLCENVRMLM
ncbi:LIPT Lipoyltransferase, partial [Nothoprocta pentlandii]|nr:LIPT Lipoyltransferase [Nothoprocta pentlandii]